MPHLQDSKTKEGTNKGHVGKRELTETVASDTNKATNPLLALAATAREHANHNQGAGETSLKKRKFEDEDNSRGQGYAPVTPSPFGRGMNFYVHPHAVHHGQTMPYPPPGRPFGAGAPSPGTRRLFPSPIRLARGNIQTGNSQKEENSDTSPTRGSSNDDKDGQVSPHSTPNGTDRKGQLPGQRPGQRSYPSYSPPYHAPYSMAHHHGMPPFPGYPGNHHPYMEHYPHFPMYDPKSPSRKQPVAEAETRGFSPMKKREQIEKEGDRRNDLPSGRTEPSNADEEEPVELSENEKEVPVKPTESPEEEPVEATESDKESPSDSEASNPTKKQRIISPSSSLEVVSQASIKGDDEESFGGKPRDVSVASSVESQSEHHPHPQAPPHISRARGVPFHPNGPRYPYPPQYPEGVAMHGWHHPYPHPMAPMHHPGMMYGGVGHPPHMNHHYPMGPPPQAKRPRLSPPTPPKQNVPVTVQSSEKKAKNASATKTVVQVKGTKKPIKSVAEWQKATLATGLAPSAHRCVPLKGPIPSKYWGEAEKVQDMTMPDYHNLVNYPDYMAKNASTPNAIAFAQEGKKHCVMCGKERVSSANAMSRSRSSAKNRSTCDSDSDNGTTHIIPRQNKGLCTACDVRVWIICDSGLEIKWCKGCKNFRPWAAFGDKGLATKCVRCRDRQREKYAMQKDELKQRRNQKRVTTNSHPEMAAARGLRNLIAASAEMDDKE